MATSYSSLKSEIADFLERNDLTSVIDTFIDLCEAEMQRRIRITSFESEGTIAVTAGSGSLPSDFVQARSVTWDGDETRVLQYVTPDYLERVLAGNPSLVSYYSIVGDSIKVAAANTGTVNLTYRAKFTPLSDSATTNAILTNHPGAYLYGSLVHASAYLKDAASGPAYRQLFDLEIEQINKDAANKRFTGQLQQRLA